MVVALGPGKFYGSSLPRPRIYDNSAAGVLHLNDQRIDPPLPVTDPLLSWASEAHWSMGGLSFKHQRLQGKIEGNIKRLRAAEEQEKRRSARNPSKKARRRAAADPPLSSLPNASSDEDGDEDGDEVREPPPPEMEVRKPLLRRLRRGRKSDANANANADAETSPIRDASPEVEISRPLRRLRKKIGAERNGADRESSSVTRARAKRECDDDPLETASVSPKLRTSLRIAKDKRIRD